MPKERQQPLGYHDFQEGNSSAYPYPSSSSSIQQHDNSSSGSSSNQDNNNYNSNQNSNTTEFNNDNNCKWSCNGCKRSHKRCDKKLPSCSRCKEKGWTCSYDKKDKRMKPIHVMNELNNNNGINNLNNLNNNQSIIIEIGNNGITLQCDHSLNSEMLQVYVNVLLIGFPCLAIEDYETMLKKTSKELNERKDILGLLLSIQCLCEQLFGFLEIAEKTAIKSKNAIIHVFDQFNNPIVANAFLNLATFYSSIGNYETSRGYLNMVEHFTNITKTINPFEHEFNEIYNCRVEISSFKVFSAIIELNCCDSYPIPDITCLTKLFSFVNYLTKKDISVNLESNIENRIENTKVFAYSLSNGRRNRESRERPLISQVLSNLSINIFNNGINIIKSIIDGDKLKDNRELLDENTKIMEYYAYQVIKLCENNLQVLLPSYLTSFIVIAVKVNFEIFKLIVRGDRQNNQPTLQQNENGLLEKSNETIEYYNLMVFGLNILKQLSKIYPNIAKIYQEMNQYIQNNTSLFNMDSFIPANSENHIPIENIIDLIVENSMLNSDIYSEMKNFVQKLKERSLN